MPLLVNDLLPVTECGPSPNRAKRTNDGICGQQVTYTTRMPKLCTGIPSYAETALRASDLEFSGRVNVNVLPRPNSLVTSSLP